MIAVCLLTSDRAAYTFRTLKAFHDQHVGRRGLTLLHADDGSHDGQNDAFASGFGFETVYRAPTRVGSGPALRAMWREAQRRGCGQILHLENDQEFVAPIPAWVESITYPCVRLYGQRKMRGDGPRAQTGPRDLATGKMVDWQASTHHPGWEIGHTHWGGQASITRTALLVNAVAFAARIKDVTLALSCLTLRPVENITWHIGEVTTGGPG